MARYNGGLKGANLAKHDCMLLEVELGTSTRGHNVADIPEMRVKCFPLRDERQDLGSEAVRMAER